MDPVADLLARWREDAEVLRRHGRDDQADRLERRADEVERALRDRRHQELTVAEAAAESGFAEKTLRRMVREGRVPDPRPDGSRAEIRIRRADLPRKPGGGRDDVSEAVARHVGRVRSS